MKKNQNKTYLFLSGIGILLITILIGVTVFSQPKKPDAFRISVLQMENIFEDGRLQTEAAEKELCHFLTRGFCEEAFSPVTLSEQENQEGIQAMYGVFSQASYIMADLGELFGLDGEEENFDELTSHTIEYDHAVLFYVPDTKIQYLFLANTLLVSKEEVLKLAEQISFSKKSFSPGVAENYLKSQEEQKNGLKAETKQIVHKIEEWRRFFRDPERENLDVKRVLEITLLGKEENLLPEGLLEFAVWSDRMVGRV